MEIQMHYVDHSAAKKEEEERFMPSPRHLPRCRPAFTGCSLLRLHVPAHPCQVKKINTHAVLIASGVFSMRLEFWKGIPWTVLNQSMMRTVIFAKCHLSLFGRTFLKSAGPVKLRWLALGHRINVELLKSSNS